MLLSRQVPLAALTACALVLTGGMSDGAALWAARCLGYDLAMFGTRFIATHESNVTTEWQAALERCTMDDVTLKPAPNGIVASGLPGDVGSAGHTISAVTSRQSVARWSTRLRGAG